WLPQTGDRVYSLCGVCVVRDSPPRPPLSLLIEFGALRPRLSKNGAVVQFEFHGQMDFPVGIVSAIACSRQLSARSPVYNVPHETRITAPRNCSPRSNLRVCRVGSPR